MLEHRSIVPSFFDPKFRREAFEAANRRLEAQPMIRNPDDRVGFIMQVPSLRHIQKHQLLRDFSDLVDQDRRDASEQVARPVVFPAFLGWSRAESSTSAGFISSPDTSGARVGAAGWG
jgi:hypothetical protein